MNRRGLVVVFAVFGLVTTAGAASVLAGVGPGSAALGDVLGEEERPPALLSFDVGDVRCTDDFSTNSSTAVSSGGANTEITYTRNVSLPGASYAVGGPSLERHNESTYDLSIPFEETDETPRECAGVVRYEATMRIPAGDDPWRLRVHHDGETVTTIKGDSDSTGVGGSVSVGESVSE